MEAKSARGNYVSREDKIERSQWVCLELRSSLVHAVKKAGKRQRP
jgi:hypothetical protein